MPAGSTGLEQEKQDPSFSMIDLTHEEQKTCPQLLIAEILIALVSCLEHTAH